MNRCQLSALVLAGAWLLHPLAHAGLEPVAAPLDARVRVAPWRDQEIYELEGRVGYQIDLEFEADESFVGLASGDLDAITFLARANHLFIKPKAAPVHTNITVLTSLRSYQFSYAVMTDAARNAGDASHDASIFVLRFTYPPKETVDTTADKERRIDAELRAAAANRSVNIDYWYCGAAAIKPEAVSDDGLHTRFRFAARGELPVLFVRNADGSESLLNFSIDDGDVIVHRVAPAFVVRRGRLTGCIVNKAYRGAGDRPASGTVAPAVRRVTPLVSP